MELEDGKKKTKNRRINFKQVWRKVGGVDPFLWTQVVGRGNSASF